MGDSLRRILDNHRTKRTQSIKTYIKDLTDMWENTDNSDVNKATPIEFRIYIKNLRRDMHSELLEELDALRCDYFEREIALRNRLIANEE
jgi:hypothetical protein